MLSYNTVKEAEADRDMQRSLLVALDASKRSLRRDECGAWSIMGRHGHVYTWGPSGGWLIHCAPSSPRKWTNVKKRLSFCQLTQDGNDEGCFRLFDLPPPEQAVLIRKAIGLKRRKRHPGNLSHLKFTTARRGFQRRQRARRVRAVSLPIPRRSKKKLARAPPLSRLRSNTPCELHITPCL
jgi:hypothetical protein